METAMTPEAGFAAFCRALHENCLALQGGPRETVERETAFAAYAYVKTMRIADAGDVVLFCAAMNLLNTYVKQDQQDVGYGFKQETAHLAGVLWHVPIEGVKVDLQRDQKMSLLVVDVYGLQFSFHNVSLTQELRDLDAQHITENALSWDGVRKQMCAVTLFERAAANMLRRCRETYRGKDLDKKIAQMLDAFRAGTMGFDDLRAMI